MAGKRARAGHGKPGAFRLVYLDECEVHRHPRLTRVWRRQGTTLRVPAAGEDRKFVVYGGLDYASGRVVWRTAATKDGAAFVRTLGSLTLCRALLRAGVVDRFRVVVFPVITGSSGRDRIYDGYPDVALELVASRTFDGRIQLLEYVPTVLAGPPGTATADA